MKYTLLEMTQIILSSMDGAEVSSINDTAESLQVANVIKTCYNDIISRANLPEHYQVFELNDSGDSTKKTLMRRPSNVEEILWVKYNKIREDETDSRFENIQYLPMDEFFNMMYKLNESDDNVFSFDLTIGVDTFTIKGYNDRAPTYYTTWDDFYLLFDSYDEQVDDTLQKHKSLCYGFMVPTFTMNDAFTPDLDGYQFTLLLNEAKSLSFLELKQVQHPIAEKKARRGWITLERVKHAVKPKNRYYLDDLPNYGRK